MATAGTPELRWRLADGGGTGPDALFAADDLVERHIGRGEFRGMEFLHVHARSIINEVPKASRVPFRHTINVYRGCSHACTYCFARPTHEYLGLNSGEDSSGASSSRSTRSSSCEPSCPPGSGPATISRWAPTPIRTSGARANTT
jgi:hypothetical protein